MCGLRSASSAEVPADCGPPAGLQRQTEVRMELSAGLGLWICTGTTPDPVQPARHAGSQQQPQGQCVFVFLTVTVCVVSLL